MSDAVSNAPADLNGSAPAKTGPIKTGTQELASGWTLLLAASIGFSFFSVMLSAMGLFMQPIGKEFGWGRTLLSSGYSIATLLLAILGPFFGAMIDRFGPRRLALPGIVLTTASIAAFSLVTKQEWSWIGLWVIFGIVAVSIKSTIWTAAVVGVFEKSRGLALGLTLSGTALAQIIVPPLGNLLIESFGWRAAFVWLAIGWGGLTFLLCLFFFVDAHSRAAKQGLKVERQGKAGNPLLAGLTIPQASRNVSLWKLAISNFIVMTLTQGLGVHLFPIMTDAGVSRGNAALLMSLSGVAAIIGKLVTGALLDRYRPNWTGGLTLGAAAFAFFLLIFGSHSIVLIIIAMVINGYAAGTKTHITGFLTAEYGGMKNFGAIYGFMSSLMALAAGVGPLLAGAIFDMTGNYNEFLIAGTIGCAIGGLIIISMPAYPDWKKGEAPVEA